MSASAAPAPREPYIWQFADIVRPALGRPYVWLDLKHIRADAPGHTARHDWEDFERYAEVRLGTADLEADFTSRPGCIVYRAKVTGAA